MRRNLKIGSAFLSALLAVCLLASCGKSNTPSAPELLSDYPQSSAAQGGAKAPLNEEQSDKETENPVTSKTESKTEASKHTHKYSAVKTPATCKERGYTTYTCSCGDSYTDDYVTGTHEYVNNKCKYCGKANTNGIYAHLKDWVLKNGKVNGDYVSYSRTSDTYGGYGNADFSLTYWNDTEKLEFCLHSPSNDTYSHNFFIYIPKVYNGSYDYISSYYYRSNGVSKYESKGLIEASVFTKNYPLKSTSYSGAADRQNSFLEESREGICDALDCLGQFLKKENIGYTLEDLGFTKFS